MLAASRKAAHSWEAELERIRKLEVWGEAETARARARVLEGIKRRREEEEREAPIDPRELFGPVNTRPESRARGNLI
jgi:hypothetical protein